MILPPPRSPLFPYTTLFRSSTTRHHHPAGPPGHSAVDARPPRSPAPEDPPWPSPRWHSAPDRKSTRLNSSHANISYAVFCLKKKKTKLNYTHLPQVI